MKFIVAIEPGTDQSAFGVVIPNFPGCFSTGDTLDEALDKGREASDLWGDTIIEEGGDIPTNKTLTEHQANKAFSGWIWAGIDAPVERYFEPAEIINTRYPNAY